MEGSIYQYCYLRLNFLFIKEHCKIHHLKHIATPHKNVRYLLENINVQHELVILLKDLTKIKMRHTSAPAPEKRVKVMSF